MFDSLLKSKFYSKCKSDIKLTRTRIELIKRKRNATQKYLRNDVADLLRDGMDYNAYCRAEGLLAEMNRSQCYLLIDQYCDFISNNLSAMDKQRECPEDCREAASSLMFAAARFADLPELREMRTMFSERYGNSSLEYYVNKQFAEKLKSGLPSKDMKLQLLQEIAAESGLEWNEKALENKIFSDAAHTKKISEESKDTDEDRLLRRKESASPRSNGTEVDKIDKVDLSEPSDAGENDVKAEPRLKSVRTRTLKPSQVGDTEGDKKEKANKEKAALGQRVLKFLDGGRGDQRDEEEKVMDRLLQHYSRKKSAHKEGELESKLNQTASANSSKAGRRRIRDGAGRVTSLPSELTTPFETPKTHTRAASFHPDNAHVHPKLPDYDDFVARLAAYRGK